MICTHSSERELQKAPLLTDHLLSLQLVILEVLLLSSHTLLGDVLERLQLESDLLKSLLDRLLVTSLHGLQREELGSRRHDMWHLTKDLIIRRRQKLSGNEDVEESFLLLPVLDRVGQRVVPAESDSLILKGVGFGQRGTVVLWHCLGVPDVRVEGLGERVGVDVAERGNGARGVEEEGLVGGDGGEKWGEDLEKETVFLSTFITNLISPHILLFVQLGIPRLLLHMPLAFQQIDQHLEGGLLGALFSRDLLSEPVDLAPVVRALDVCWNGARPLDVEAPQLVVGVTVADGAEQLKGGQNR